MQLECITSTDNSPLKESPSNITSCVTDKMTTASVEDVALRPDLILEHDNDIVIDQPQNQVLSQADSIPEPSSLNEEDVIAELQHILDLEELDMASVSSSSCCLSLQKKSSTSTASHEKLLSDSDMVSDIKLIQGPGTETFETLQDDLLCGVRDITKNNDHDNEEVSESETRAPVVLTTQSSLERMSNVESSTESSEESSEPVRVPPVRPGSPLSLVRPLRTSLSSNTLALLHNRRQSVSPDRLLSSDISSRIGSLLGKSGPSQRLDLHPEADPPEEQHQVRTAPLYPAPHDDSSPELYTLPDQRTYYRTVVVEPLTPCEEDRSTSGS